MNSELTKKAKIDFEEDFSSWWTKIFLGKTMEDTRKDKDI